jgi:hypothetical protein
MLVDPWFGTVPLFLQPSFGGSERAGKRAVFASYYQETELGHAAYNDLKQKGESMNRRHCMTAKKHTPCPAQRGHGYHP